MVTTEPALLAIPPKLEPSAAHAAQLLMSRAFVRNVANMVHGSSPFDVGVRGFAELTGNAVEFRFETIDVLARDAHGAGGQCAFATVTCVASFRSRAGTK